MSRLSHPARLWLEPEEFDTAGKRQRYATWVIRDGKIKIRTGCPAHDSAGAERKLAEYLAIKHQLVSPTPPDGDPLCDCAAADACTGHCLPEPVKLPQFAPIPTTRNPDSVRSAAGAESNLSSPERIRHHHVYDSFGNRASAA